MTCAGDGVAGRKLCGLIDSRAATGAEGDVGFPLVTFVVVTPGLPAGAVVGGVTAGSCANGFACGFGPPVGGVCATGGLVAGAVVAFAGAVVLAGAVAVLG